MELDGLTKRCGDVIALDGLAFSVSAGSLHGFVGPNGAGKTTAMRIVLGALGADAGEVVVSLATALATIGALVPLAARLYAGSVLQVRTRVSVRRA